MKKAPYSLTFLGLFDTDRDLIRQSPCHILFVKDRNTIPPTSVTEINRIITAVGAQNYEVDFISHLVYRVFNVARTLSNKFDAENVPVHEYSNYAPYLGEMGDPTSIETAIGEEARQIATQHGKSISAFLEYFNIKPEMLQVCQGPLPVIIEELSESLHVDLIIMAARNLSRWERLTESAMGMTSAGPVLSKAPCEILYVKDKSNTKQQIR